jgi:aromatic-L-amino-acid decarboxylase
VDARHRLVTAGLVEAIERDLAHGAVPVAVVASAGTTLTGAIDPLQEIAEECGRRSIWLHVDGAYGLPAAALPGRAARFAGVERADSVTIDAHKWLYLPKACGVVLVRDPSALAAAFAHEESYMPHEHGELHAVDLTLEYSRPFRALKLWLAFRVHGANALRDAIQRNLDQTRLLVHEIARHDDLELLMEPELSIVLFRHLPGDGERRDEHNARLAERLQEDGRVYVASARVDGAEWLRPCFVNYRTTDDDVRAFVDVVRELGRRALRNPDP